MYARWGETKLKMLKTDGKTYGEFGFLDAARVNYDTDGFKPGGVASVPVLVSDINGDRVNGNIEIS